ncbi:hypothetical protein AN958_00304 [Leucoagaricus sp. SymC.cos]|nr:hypothetical protein AN958_00304 [Leucoagaricus sp. SymC.cos]
MVRSANGYVEGKVVETKFGKIDPDEDFPPLRDLLIRKKEWERLNAHRKPTFPHKLIKDVSELEHFNCTVELLHLKNDKDSGRVYFDVTDYTSNPELPTQRDKQVWSRGLGGRIMRIHLRDAQVAYANRLSLGKFLTISNLRLRSTDGKLEGTLGGQDQLIHLLNEQNPNHDLQGLLNRKTTWKREQEKSPILQFTERSNSTIKDFEANPKEQFTTRIIGRVVDYYPHSPEGWIQSWCSQCKQRFVSFLFLETILKSCFRIPDGRKACHNCQDIDHDFVQHKIELILRVEDQAGDKMELQLRSESNILQEFDIRNCEQYCSSIHQDLAKKLRPLIGKLDKRTELKQASPFLSLLVSRLHLPTHGTIRLLLDMEK